MDKETLEKIRRISEKFFGTQSDPDQMPVNQESADKLHAIHPDTIIYKFDGPRNPIAWSVVVPTSIGVMNGFLNKEISEKELLDMATEEKKFEALYLCAVFVLPEYRGKGYAKQLLTESIDKLSKGKVLPLYCWIYSKEGAGLINLLSQELGREIARRND
ncbi:MAG: GNAT family N-acetyltransferase [Patescibacteria group bacterium]